MLSTDEAVTKDLKVETFVETVTSTLKTKFEGDGTFADFAKGKVGAILAARDQNIIKAAREHGVDISNEEYKALPEKDRTDELNKLVLKRLAEKKAPTGDDDKTKEIERLNKDIVSFKEKVKELEETVIPGIKSESENKLTQFEITTNLRSEFSRINNGKLVAPEKVVLPGVEQEFYSKYDVKKEDGKIVLYEKGKSVKAYKDSKEVTMDMALEEITVGLDLRKKQDPPKKDPIQDPGNKKDPSTIHQKRVLESIERKKAELKAK
jgi:hypothetical protein